jgi:hypothetical protein
MKGKRQGEAQLKRDPTSAAKISTSINPFERDGGNNMRNFALRASPLLIAASIAAVGSGSAAHAAGDDSATTQAAMWPGGAWSPPSTCNLRQQAGPAG